jgi:hypothetical protein
VPTSNLKVGRKSRGGSSKSEKASRCCCWILSYRSRRRQCQWCRRSRRAKERTEERKTDLVEPLQELPFLVRHHPLDVLSGKVDAVLSARRIGKRVLMSGRKSEEDERGRKEREGKEETEKLTFKSPIQTSVSQSHTPYPSCVPPSGLGASGLKFGVHRSLSLPFSRGKSNIDAVSRA